MNKKILCLIILFLSNIMFAKILKIKVIDATNNQPLSDVEVMAVGFIEGNEEPLFHLCDVQKTGASGEVVFNSNKLVDLDPVSGSAVVYKIGFSKNRYLPTIKQQIVGNLLIEVKFSFSNNEIDLTNTPFVMFPAPQNFQSGELELDIFGSNNQPITSSLIGILELKHSITQEIEALNIFVSDGSNPVNIQNVPPAETGVYKLSVYVPSTNEGAEVIVSTAVYNGKKTKNPTPIYLGYITSTRSDTTQPLNTPSNVAFEGIVLDTSSRPISNCYVKVISSNPQQSFITNTDSSGRFFVPSLAVMSSTFSVLISKLGYIAKLDTNNYLGYYYDGINRVVLPKYFLEEANGVVKGKIWIKKPSDPTNMSKGFPDLKVVLIPENYMLWQGPYVSKDASGFYTTVSGGNGLFEIKGVSPGQYNLLILHPLLAKNTSYWKGSGEADPKQIWNYSYEYNLGENQKLEVSGSGYRIGDDLRIVITSDTMKLKVFNVNGSTVDFDYSWNDEKIHIYLNIDVSSNAVIKGNFYFPTTVSIPEEDAIKVIAYPFNPLTRNFLDWSSEGTIFFADPNGLWGDGNHKPIYIEVSTGSYYVEVKSSKWVPVKNYNPVVIVSTPASVVTLPDIYLTKGGRIEGKIKLPDGSYFQSRKFPDGSWLEGEIEIRGVNVDFNKHFRMDEYLPEPTKFEFDILPPGMYNLIVRINKGLPQEKNVKEFYPASVVSNVRVYPEQTTYVEAVVKDGVMCEALSPIPPDKPEVDYSKKAAKDLPPNYGIVGFPTDIPLKGQTLQYVINNQGVLENVQIPVLYFDKTTKTWPPKKILTGKYNFYLVLIRFFGTEIDKNSGPDEYITVLSKAENVEIKTEDLIKESTFQIYMGAGVMGSGVITGRIKGNMMLTLQDSQKIRNNFREFLEYIPTLMIYDMDGNWRGYSAARPKLEDLSKWEVAINNGDVQIINNMINSDDENIASHIYYYIDNLPLGKYVVVCETKNYPIVTKVVEISTGITKLDIDFDKDATLGLKLTGYIKDEDGNPIPNANVVITHRLTKKKTTTDQDGKFEIFGLPQGIMKVDVLKDGYAIAGEKISLGREDKEVNIKLKKAGGKILGKVYIRESNWSRKNIYSGAKIVAYNETENVLNPAKYLPSVVVKSQDDGRYIIPDVIVGNTYYVYAFVPERPVYYRLVYVSTDTVSNIDFDIKPSTPTLKVTMKRTGNPYVFRFIIESPRPLANVPECYYSEGSYFNPDKKIRALPSKGAKNTFNLDIEIPRNSNEENYTLYIKAQYGVKEYITETITFSQKSMIDTKKEISEELAEGGSLLIDDERSDNTEAQIDPGTFTPEEFASMPIGGFLSSLPTLKMTKTSKQIISSFKGKLEDIIASDTYEINLSKTQVNKSFSIALSYIREKVSESELQNLRIYYYDENDKHNPWKPIAGTVTIDPLTATVSVETETLEPKSNTIKTKSVGKSVIRNGVYAFNPQTSTSQTGIFAVFKVDPSSAGVYKGSEFKIYNFPNPFDLKEKNVYLYDAVVQNQTTKGTIIKYFLPKGKDGELKFYIYNLAGELVKIIDVGEKTSGHFYYTEWDGTNQKGEKCASGVYFLVAKLKGEKLNKPYKIVILK